jgi:hypothetical protein
MIPQISSGSGFHTKAVTELIPLADMMPRGTLGIPLNLDTTVTKVDLLSRDHVSFEHDLELM